MSKKQLHQYARRELHKLNNIIDRKILAGKSYKIEAMVHTRLVRSLA